MAGFTLGVRLSPENEFVELLRVAQGRAFAEHDRISSGLAATALARREGRQFSRIPDDHPHFIALLALLRERKRLENALAALGGADICECY